MDLSKEKGQMIHYGQCVINMQKLFSRSHFISYDVPHGDKLYNLFVNNYDLLIK